MLQLVNVGHKSLADYATIATRGLMDEIRRLAEPLAGKRIVHLSATAFGGGVAEINYTLIPLMQSAGLETEWRIIRGAEEFFNVTKTIHNGLQGNPQGLTEEQKRIFVAYQALNAKEIDPNEYDFVVVHDPQPVGMIDHSAPNENPNVSSFERPDFPEARYILPEKLGGGDASLLPSAMGSVPLYH